MALLRFTKVVPPSLQPSYHSVPLLVPALVAVIAASLAGPVSRAAGDATLPRWAGFRVRGWAVVIIGLILALGFPRFLAAARSGQLGRYKNRHGPSLSVLFGVICAALLLGSFRATHWRNHIKGVHALARRGTFEASILVCGDPATLARGRLAFKARILEMSLDGNVSHVMARMQTAGPEETQRQPQAIRVGDIITVRGRVSTPKGAMNPGEFDYGRYLASKRIFAVFDGVIVSDLNGIENGEKTASGHGVGIGVYRLALGTGARIRAGVRRAIGAVVPPLEAAVMQGVLLADDTGLGEEDSTNLDRAGLGRFLSVTGFYVTMVSQMAELALGRLTRKGRVLATGVSLAAVVAAAGAGWSVGALRACVCAVMRATAPVLRRRYHQVAGLSAAALVCAWVLPFPLTDLGFRLSFAACTGAFFGQRYRTGGRLSGASALAGMVLFTVPFMAQDFPEISLMGFALGGVWAALITLLVPVAALTAAFPWFMVYLGWIPYWLVRGIRIVSAWLATCPFAALPLAAPSSSMGLWYFASVLVLILTLEDVIRARAGLRKTSISRRSRHALAMAVVSAAFVFSTWIRMYAPWPSAAFLAVGQGDCVILRHKGKVVIVDTGTEQAMRYSVLPYLRWAGIKEVDLCVLSHLHADHAGGLPPLAENVRVNAILTATGTAAEVRTALNHGTAAEAPISQWADEADIMPATRVLSVTAASSIPITEAVFGATYIVGPWTIRVDSAGGGSNTPASDVNEECLVVTIWADAPSRNRAGHDRIVFEFWGDAPSSLVSSTLENMSRDGIRIVKVPHHGSIHSLVPRLYDDVQAGLAIVSVGPNSYGHPSYEVMDYARSVGLSVWRTDACGAVNVTIKKRKVYLDTYIESLSW